MLPLASMTPKLAYDECCVSRSAKSEEAARVLDESLVIRRNEAGQPHGLLLHLRLS